MNRYIDTAWIDPATISAIFGAHVRVIQSAPLVQLDPPRSIDRVAEWRERALTAGHVPHVVAHAKQRKGIDWHDRRSQRKGDEPRIKSGILRLGPDQFLPRRVR